MTNNLAKLAGSCCSFSCFEINIYHSYTGTGFAAWKHGGSVEERLVEYLDSKGAYLYGGAVNAAVQQKEST